MSGKIFLNYRRADSHSWTLLLREKLIVRLGEGGLFHDLSGVPLGTRLRPYLAAQVADCVGMITVIGPQWLEILRERSEGSAPDHVLIEIEEALSYGKGIIPVLVGGARMPAATDLPNSIRQLADRAGMALAPERLDADVSALMAGLTRIITAAKSEGRIYESNVDTTAGGNPKLVAKGNIWSSPTVRVNQTPLRAAHAADMAPRTPATGKASGTTAKTEEEP